MAILRVKDKNGWHDIPALVGPTPNLQIGAVETLESGSEATANITDTPENPLLNLGIPKGPQGADGSSNVAYDAGTGNLQIGDNALGGVFDWSFEDGMLEDNGYTYTGTDGAAAMEAEGLSLTSGALYVLPKATAHHATLEIKFKIQEFATRYYGFCPRLTNGTKGIKVSIYNGKLFYNQATSNNLSVADLAVDTDYTLRIEFDETTGGNVWLNDEQVITNGFTNYELPENVLYQEHSGKTLLQSIKYSFDDTAGGEVTSINGIPIKTNAGTAELELIASGTMEEDARGVTISVDDNGEAFDLVVAALRITNATIGTEMTANVNVTIQFGDYLLSDCATVTTSATNRDILAVLTASGICYCVQGTGAARSKGSCVGWAIFVPQQHISKVSCLASAAANTIAAGTQYYLYGVRA